MKNIIKRVLREANLKENIDDILDRIGDVGFDKLTPSEKKKLSAYQKHLESGGKENDFKYDEQPNIHELSGKKFKTIIDDEPLIFVFSEKVESEDGGYDYYGEVIFNDTEYVGLIYTDEKDYLLGYDFYDSEDNTADRLQDILKEKDYQLDNFFQNEVLPNLV